MRTKNSHLIKTIILFSLAIAMLFVLQIRFIKSERWREIRQGRCDHEQWTDGICKECSLECKHEEWENSHCLKCGVQCIHSWEDSKCLICGAICIHDNFRDMRCTQCGQKCNHENYSEGICDQCGYQCPHQWSYGICSICNLVCTHSQHDPQTLRCVRCNAVTGHHFVEGSCDCGEKPLFYYGELPLEYYAPSDQPGEVISLSYKQQVYSSDDEYVWKNVNVYLPYGYDRQQKYNVVILIHGGGDDETAWTTQDFSEYYGHTVVLKNIYDNMIEKHLCAPFIVVSPTTYNYPGRGRDCGFEHMAKELRETIMPYIADHFSTFAETGKLEDLQKARMHFAVGGVSNGSLFALDSGMQMNFDLFGSYACFSGNNQPELVAEAINSEAWANLPVGYFFTGAGTDDDMRDWSRRGFNYLVNSTDRLKEGKNCCYIEVEGGHEWIVWSTEIFNALQVIFS